MHRVLKRYLFHRMIPGVNVKRIRTLSRTALRQLFTASFLLTTFLCSSAASAQDVTPTHSTVPLTLTVNGRVTSGTGGVTIPAGLPIVLQIAHQDQSTDATVEAYK